MLPPKRNHFANARKQRMLLVERSLRTVPAANPSFPGKIRHLRAKHVLPGGGISSHACESLLVAVIESGNPSGKKHHRMSQDISSEKFLVVRVWEVVGQEVADSPDIVVAKKSHQPIGICGRGGIVGILCEELGEFARRICSGREPASRTLESEIEYRRHSRAV